MNAKKLASFVKNNRISVSKFLIKHGEKIERSDSDVKLGMKLERVFAGDRASISEFENLIGESLNADGLTSEQSGDLTIELINSSIKKEKYSTSILNIFFLIGIIALLFYLLNRK